jgi:glycosyltransferase involved in cell wall biosynthesis
MGGSLEAALGEDEEASGVVARTAVLLCSFNGDRYLDKQLESIACQHRPGVRVYVSDDGSNDQTLSILDRFRARWGEERLSIGQGPQRGYVANFFSLVCSPIEADYFAYADQDDVWHPDKLSRAITALSALQEELPAVYCSRTRLIDESGRPLGLSPRFEKPPAFANALIQNIAGGNTMVLNRKARDLICAVGSVDVVSHDWWTYLLVTGCGGTVIFDPHPSTDYRQHQDNLIGSNMAWSDRFNRFSFGLRGRKREWNTKNIAALQQHRDLLTAENQWTLDIFFRARNANLFPRLLGMWRSGVYTQSGLGTLGLLIAILLKIL